MGKTFIDNNTYVTSIDGLKSLTKANALKEIGLAFNFPTYYGENLDALEDCLTDLSWIEYEKIVLVINNFHLFLSDEPLDVREMFLEILEDAGISLKENEGKEFKLIRTSFDR